MTERICKCCGQALPPVEGFDFAMPKGMADLVNNVRRAGEWGIATDRLFDLLYADDPNGGPDTGIKVLHVRVSQANRILREHGWAIRGEHTGVRHAYGRYVLVRLDEDKLLRVKPVRYRTVGEFTRCR